jgi:hypothetical protein
MQKFIHKTKEAIQPSFNLGLVLGHKNTPGDVGIEIEVEGKNLLHDEDVPLPWVYHIDPSLRGQENAEYVIGKPITFGEVDGALHTLFNKLEGKGAEFDESNRTSVHVHMNCQGFFMNRLTSLMAMWYALEEILTEWCGEYRVGNLFCLRAVDASAIITHLRNFIKSDGEMGLGEILRYAALNPHSLHKYGSIEARTLQGCHEAKPIGQWVSILAQLHKLSGEFEDPTELVNRFSAGGPMSFFKMLLGDKVDIVRERCLWSDDEIAASMFRGIRFAQQLAYCRDWSMFKTLEIRPDPFGRDVRKLIPKIQAMSNPEPVAVVPSPAASPIFDPEDFLHMSEQAEQSLNEYVMHWNNATISAQH